MLPLAISVDAVVALAVGIPTVAATVYFGVRQIRASLFKLACEALLAEQCDSIRVTLRNRGSVEGTVHGLEVTDAEGGRIELAGAGKSFKGLKLKAGSATQLDFNAPADRDFKTTDKVVVRWGKKADRLDLLPTQGSFYDPEQPVGDTDGDA